MKTTRQRQRRKKNRKRKTETKKKTNSKKKMKDKKDLTKMVGHSSQKIGQLFVVPSRSSLWQQFGNNLCTTYLYILL